MRVAAKSIQLPRKFENQHNKQKRGNCFVENREREFVH